MSTQTLFLAWQDKARSRQWFPVGQLDADPAQSFYRYRYTQGAVRAQREAQFPLAMEFPDLQRDYRSSELFSLFKNRVIASGRPDRGDYLQSLGLPEDEKNPIEILSVDGGQRVTDTFEVFPKIEKQPDGGFTCRFFLHGWRHINEYAQAKIEELDAGDELYITLEFTNPETQYAVQVQTLDYHMIGWAPRYLAMDLMLAMAKEPAHYTARVIRRNPLPAPSKQRLLVEMTGYLNGYEPMSSEDYQPLAGP